MPVRASWAGRGASPPSTTMRTPSTVSDVSAMSVASTTRRRPAPPAARARSCSAAGRDPCSARTSTPRSARSARAQAARSISPDAGEERRARRRRSASRARRTPRPPRSRRRGATSSPARRGDGRRPPHVDREGAALGLHDRAPPRSAATFGDVERRRHGEDAEVGPQRCAAPRWRGRARGRSTRWRSCTSSNTTSAVPGSVGSDCSRRVRMPSVTTSMRRRRPDAASSRVR